MRPSPLTASTIRDMPLDLVDRIRSFPLFMSAPEEFLAAIGNHLRPQVHSAQDHIVNEGDDAKAMYWLVRGVVAVTSRDGEAVYAELKPGAFFGEIGVLMNIPRTASIIARTKCLLVVLKKEDLQAELPKFPDMEKAIRQEAQERLNILKKKRQEGGTTGMKLPMKGANPSREPAPGEVATGERGAIKEGTAVNSKKRKSPSPGAIEDPAAGSALGSGFVNVRKTLKELPLFSTLPPDILHYLGLSCQPKTYSPFTNIIRQGNPGNEIFFIVRGEAEVIHENANGPEPIKRITRSSYVRPRLKQGQYFGEVASLGLSPGRTATVRSITTVECLMIGGEALDELWRKCPPDIRLQVEETARKRYKLSDEDVDMKDADDKEKATSDSTMPTTPTKQILPHVTFTTPSKPSSPSKDDMDTMEPKDPDPFLSVDMENMRNRRRNSLAPPVPQTDNSSPAVNGIRSHLIDTTPLKFFMTQPSVPVTEAPSKRARILPRRPHSLRKAALPDDIMVAIFGKTEVTELLRLRQISTHWRRLLSTSPKLCVDVDLSMYNRKVTDSVIARILGPFIGTRPASIDISNCFHITDEGFNALWKMCGKNVKTWKMRSVWDVSANQILEMSENAKGLEEVDWSNCRKVGDNLLARVVGWVVPEPPPPPPAKVVIANSAANKGKASSLPQKLPAHQHQQRVANMPPPGTVIGCSNLKKLNLSYCKHITDRSMAHLAAHAHTRLQSLSLTRCTSITDAGFQSWAPFRFAQLESLCLADCTYLSDNAIVALVNAAKNLTFLDLSFCCALSDTATEVVALGLPQLRELRLAFCGSAVSDASLGGIALHLNELEGLSVRGCVRVTGTGVEGLLEGCGRLRWLDVSQCRNLESWVRGGGVGRWGIDDRGGNGLPPGEEVNGSMVPVSMPGFGGVGSVGSGGGAVRTGSVGGVGFGTGTSMGMGMGMRRRARKPVRFIIEKGAGGLR
jgi:F-box and leucine-rich repeat protein 7